MDGAAYHAFAANRAAQRDHRDDGANVWNGTRQSPGEFSSGVISELGRTGHTGQTSKLRAGLLPNCVEPIDQVLFPGNLCTIRTIRHA